MKTPARIAFVTLITMGCAVEASSPTGLDSVIPQGGSGSGGSSGDATAGSSMSGGTGFSGSTSTAGTTTTAGTSSGGTFGEPIGGTFGNPVGGGGMGGTTAGSGGAGGSGSAGKSAGGSAGTASGGTGGTNSGTAGTATGGTAPVGPYCDGKALSPLPYVVNEGFQPSGWQGDFAAISAANITPDGCAQRSPGAVGECTPWRYTPNAVTPAWAGVLWSRVWDANYTHPPVCIANGATKVTFQAKGAVGGEQIIASAAGAQEYPFTLTNDWQEYSISLAGITYNSYTEGVTGGFFWKVAPPTPGGGAVTFFIDDIKIEQ